MHLFGLIVIGAILLIITCAFAFSAKFRKDVIAAEGEASVLGFFNVKGVMILLLVAIFSGTFIYIIDALPSDESGSGGKVAPAKLTITADGHERLLLHSGEAIRRAGSLLEPDHGKIVALFKQPYHMAGLPAFYYRIDSVWYTGGTGRKSTYQYAVSVGEEDAGGNVLWKNTPIHVTKTADGAITGENKFEKVSDPRWKKQYRVLFALGQPDSLLRFVEKGYLVIASVEAELKKE